MKVQPEAGPAQDTFAEPLIMKLLTGTGQRSSRFFAHRYLRKGPVLDYLPAEPVGSGVKTAEGEGVSRGDVTGDGVADTERVATGVGGGVAVGALVGWSVLAVVGFGAGFGLVVRAGAGM